uniref:Rad21_Rec8 domain-containing protein n=1 Tax=Macrostomum lignano TaxID=282301 RepID=A0A1I8FUX4_9PLAT
MDSATAFIVQQLFFTEDSSETSILVDQANRDNVLAATAALTTVIASLNNKTEEKRHRVKVPGFVVNTVPLFTIDEFRSRYRLTRSAFEFVLGELMKYELLNQHEEPTSSKGIPGDKQLLIFLDYIGHQCNQSELEVLYDNEASFEEDLDDLIDDYQDDQLAPQNNNQTTQQKRWAIAESL